METSLTISRYNCLARMIFMPPCLLPQLQYRQAEKQFCKAHLFLHFSKSQIMKQGRKNAMYLMLQTTHPLDVSQCRTPPPGLMALFLVNCLRSQSYIRTLLNDGDTHGGIRAGGGGRQVIPSLGRALGLNPSQSRSLISSTALRRMLTASW